MQVAWNLFQIHPLEKYYIIKHRKASIALYCSPTRIKNVKTRNFYDHMTPLLHTYVYVCTYTHM